MTGVAGGLKGPRGPGPAAISSFQRCSRSRSQPHSSSYTLLFLTSFCGPLNVLLLLLHLPLQR